MLTIKSLGIRELESQVFRLGFVAMRLDGRFGWQDDEVMIASVNYCLEH